MISALIVLLQLDVLGRARSLHAMVAGAPLNIVHTRLIAGEPRRLR